MRSIMKLRQRSEVAHEGLLLQGIVHEGEIHVLSKPFSLLDPRVRGNGAGEIIGKCRRRRRGEGRRQFSVSSTRLARVLL